MPKTTPERRRARPKAEPELRRRLTVGDDAQDPIGSPTAIPIKPGAERARRMLAPAPIIDKFPIIIGSNITLQYLSSQWRLCTTGIRYGWVDAVNELLEHCPHSQGVARQRLLPLSGARVDLLPAQLPKNDTRQALAKQIAEECQRQLDNIPARAQAFGQLAWGIGHGVSGLEIEWDRRPGETIRWIARRLHFIHSRRLNYPNPMSWDVHVWDQGAIGGGEYNNRTTGPYGLRIRDYPGKFIVHTPALWGEYPTRDGVLRFTGFYMALIRMIVRCTSQDFERTIRPWVLGYFNRELDSTEHEDPIADDDDLAMLDQALDALGTGSMNTAKLPNSTKVEFIKAASKLDARQFVMFLQDQVTKAWLGQTFTTAPGANGNRSAAETAMEGTRDGQRYDAACFGDTLERDLVYWIVYLNYGPEAADTLCPRVRVRIDDKRDPEGVAKAAKLLTEQDVPLDADDLADRCGFKVVPKPAVPEGEEMVVRRTRLIAAGSINPDPAADPDLPAPPGADGGRDAEAPPGEATSPDDPEGADEDDPEDPLEPVDPMKPLAPITAPKP